ncbi:MAG: hypothetical protein RIS34_2539 [Pseudomonadota bacterium]|jgi:hypothetical protein
MTQTAFVLRIALRRSKPTVWREVLVSPNASLRDLHELIHAAMGWDDDHLYAFARPDGNKSFYSLDKSRLYEPPLEDDPWNIPGHNDATTAISEVLAAPKDRLLYMYDFGDSWEHLITLKEQVQTEQVLPALLGAQHACPLEDCGGPQGWAALCQALAEPTRPEFAKLANLYKGFDPVAFLPELREKAVAKLRLGAPRLLEEMALAD